MPWCGVRAGRHCAGSGSTLVLPAAMYEVCTVNVHVPIHKQSIISISALWFCLGCLAAGRVEWRREARRQRPFHSPADSEPVACDGSRLTAVCEAFTESQAVCIASTKRWSLGAAVPAIRRARRRELVVACRALVRVRGTGTEQSKSDLSKRRTQRQKEREKHIGTD